MLCGNCGTENPEGAEKCSACGAPLAPPEPVPAPVGEPSGEPAEKPAGRAGRGLSELSKNRLAGFGVLGGAVALVVVLLLLIFGGRSDEAALRKYVRAAYDLDAGAIVKLYPKAVVEAYADEEDISRRDAREEIAEDLQKLLDACDDLYTRVDFDEVKSLSVEIRDEDDYSKKEVRRFNQSFEDLYDEDLDAKAVKEVEIKISGKYYGDKFSVRVDGITLVKIGRSWCVLDPDVSDLYAALSAEVG